MKIHFLDLKGLALVELTLHGDARGFFVERFNAAQFQAQGLSIRIEQINHSRSAPGVLRGLHYQLNPPQGKLIGVIQGRIWDVALDIRKDSPTFGQHFGIELNATNGKLLWLPAGFAHGFCVLGNEPADVLYQVDHPYHAAGEGGILWNDPSIAISWPIQNPLLSPKDEQQVSFQQYREQCANIICSE